MKSIDLPKNVETSFLDVKEALGVVQKVKVSQKNQNTDTDSEKIDLEIDESVLDEMEENLLILDKKIVNMQQDLVQVESNLQKLDETYKKTQAKHIESEHESMVALGASNERLYTSFDDAKIEVETPRYIAQDATPNSYHASEGIAKGFERLEFEPTPEDTAPKTLKSEPEDTAPKTLKSEPEDTAPKTLESNQPPEDTVQELRAVDNNFHLGTEQTPIKNSYALKAYLNSNDKLPDDGEYTYSLKSAPSHGDVIINRDGSFNFEPDDHYDGKDSFEYELAHKDGRTSSATANFNIDSVEESIPKLDEVTTNKNTSIFIDVLANDKYVNDETKVFSVTNGSDGKTMINQDGTIIYKPNPDFIGTDSFRYTNSDGKSVGVKITIDEISNSTVSLKALDDYYSLGSVSKPLPSGKVEYFNELYKNDILPENGEYLYSLESDATHGNLLIYGDGEFKYEPDDYYSGDDSFTYTIEDNAGNKSTATAHLKINSVEQTDSTPIVLDLDGDGVETISASNGVAFDIDADGDLDKTGWVGSDDGLLVRDINNDGIINDASELFGEEMLKADGTKATDGYDVLKEYDTNSDGLVNSDDDKFDSIMIFKDSNSNGITDEGELLSLSEAGVSQLNISTQEVDIDSNGNTIGLESSYEDLDGVTQDAADVWFSYEEINFDILEQIKPISEEEKISLTLEELFPVLNSENTIHVEVNEDNEVSLSTEIQLEYANNTLDDSQFYASSDFSSVNFEVEIVVDEY